MLREDIFEIVEYASESGFITVMGSNGTLLTEERLMALKKAGLKGIGISIDSTLPEYHDSFRGMKGTWEMSINALRSAKRVGIETQIDVTLTDSNWEEIDKFVLTGIELGAKAVNFFFLVCTGRAMRTEISTRNYARALERIAELAMKEKKIMVRARCAPHVYRTLYEKGFPISAGTRGCMAGRSYIRIDPEGNVTPCPYMSLNIGNIKEQSLTTIWEHAKELKILREGRYRGRCGICEYSEICGGCRARALVEKGDILEEDSLCDYEPKGRAELFLNKEFESELLWDDEAKERITKVPLFMKRMVIRIIEERAKQNNIRVITSEFIDSIKKLFVK